MPQNIRTVGILGAGTIGASWTALFLASGYSVQVYDAAETAEQYVRDYISNAWPTLDELRLTTDGSPDRVTFHDTPQHAVEGADFVQESVPERLEIKHELFAKIEPVLQAHTVIASSASGLMVREMQEGLTDPSRLIL